MASNYRKGADDERYVMDLAHGAGCVVVRSAGSLGSADLIVCDLYGTWYALNVKRNAWAGPAERAVMADVWNGRNAWPVMVRVDASAGHRRVVRFRRVAASGALGVPFTTAPWWPE